MSPPARHSCVAGECDGSATAASAVAVSDVAALLCSGAAVRVASTAFLCLFECGAFPVVRAWVRCCGVGGLVGGGVGGSFEAADVDEDDA